MRCGWNSLCPVAALLTTCVFLGIVLYPYKRDPMLVFPYCFSCVFCVPQYPFVKVRLYLEFQENLLLPEIIIFIVLKFCPDSSVIPPISLCPCRLCTGI